MQGRGVSEQLAEPPGISIAAENKGTGLHRRRCARQDGESPPDEFGDWRWQMRHRVKTLAALRRALPDLRGTEFLEPVFARYPMAITPYYLSLVRKSDPSDPILRQCVPQPEELESPRYCLPDPLHEEKNSPVPHLIHRYEDRVLSLSSSTCPVYCRHCTRKRMSGIREGFLSRQAIARQAAYLSEHPEVSEVIISGGDPLTMSTERLQSILAVFRSVASVRTIRIGTRTPVTLPMRITDELCEALEKFHPIWLCTHFNHPREITRESAAACDKILRAGIPILNQTVLLKGVNDSPEVMLELCKELMSIRVRPYYLYQCDLVQGVEHFRTPLYLGIEICETLRNRIGGIGVPQFIVDAPEGAGKIPVSRNNIVEMRREYTLLRNRGGRVVVCPEPEDVGALAGRRGSASRASSGGHRVALVFNIKRTALSESDSDAEYDASDTIDAVARSLESLGHSVVRLEANAELPPKLAAIRPDIVFNMAESAGGRGREGHVPALCEMMGLACTGSDQTTLAVALDKALTKTILMHHEIPTPPFRLARSVEECRGLNLRFPVIVKPNHEGSSKGLLPDSVAETEEAVVSLVERVLRRYKQPAIIEECLPGREFTVGFIGGGEPESLPLLEIRFLDPSRAPIYDIELKQDPPDKVEHLCPSPADPELAEAIIAIARRAYHALSCRDICRVDVRLDGGGKPQVLEVNPLPGLAPRYSDICKMTESLGWSHSMLIARLLAPTLKRMSAAADARPVEARGG